MRRYKVDIRGEPSTKRPDVSPKRTSLTIRRKKISSKPGERVKRNESVQKKKREKEIRDSHFLPHITTSLPVPSRKSLHRNKIHSMKTSLREEKRQRVGVRVHVFFLARESVCVVGHACAYFSTI